MKKFIALILFMFIHSTCFATGTLTEISGTLQNGQQANVSGSGLGVYVPDIQWLGGPSGNIENGTIGTGFAETDWLNSETTAAGQEAVYSGDIHYSGIKAIESSWPLASQYYSGFVYVPGAYFTEIYATWYTYFYHDGTNTGQWKHWRVRPDYINYFGDVDGEVMYAQWYLIDSTNKQNTTYPICDKPNLGTCVPDGESYYGTNEDYETPGVWIKNEVYLHNSTPDTDDGVLYWTITRSGETKTVKKDWPNLVTNLTSSTATDYSNMGFENFWGNIDSGKGFHDGVDGSASFTDSTKTWTVNQLDGGTITNSTTGAVGDITENTSDTITAILIGGTSQVWSTNDSMVIHMPEEGTNEKVYYDDIYIQIDGRARLEIINDVVYANATIIEVQPPVTCIDGQWDFTVNQGTIPDGGAWIVQVSQDGTISNSLPVTFGAGTSPVVTLEADKEATNPTTYTFSFTLEAGRTATTVISSGGGTVVCDDGDCTDEASETGVVSNVPVPSTDTLTVTDSSAEVGQDSIVLTLPTASPTPSTALNTGTLKQISNTGTIWRAGN